MIRSVSIKRIKKHACVSFDIFDTLVKRRVSSPHHIFFYAAISVKERVPGLNPGDFMLKRIEAERKARANSDTEITLADIYKELEPFYSFTELKILWNAECQAEIDFCYANKEVLAIYKKAIALGKKVILTSDMYLPRDVIETILIKCDILSYDRLYLSCEERMCKSNGVLYSYICRNENIKPKDIIHFGDNIKSDGYQAVKAGWNISCVLAKKKEYQLGHDLLPLFLEERNKQHIGNYEFGYSYFGPFLFGFLLWLAFEFKKQGINTILFLSRDGYIMKKEFEAIQKDKFNSLYFYASRRALHVPVIWKHPEYEDVINSMFIPKNPSIKWVLERWGLEPEEYKDLVEKSSLSLETKVSGKTLIENAVIRELYNSLKQRIIDNSQREFAAFKTYIEQIGLKNDIAFVDIGWHGNMQNAFEQLLKETRADNLKVHGYYIAISPSSTFPSLYHMSGYLYDTTHNQELFARTKYFNTLLETLFMAPHGSTEKYTLSGRVLQIKQEKNEYSNTETEKTVDKIQKGAFQFIEDFSVFLPYIEPDAYIYSKKLLKELKNPCCSIANMLGELKYEDNGMHKIANKRNLIYAFLHPKRTLSEFDNSSWKNGFLKRMLWMPLPYDDMVYFLRKIKNKEG